jgi:hypothetical protein
MKLYFFPFLLVTVLALVVQSNSTPGLRLEDREPAEALAGILDNSINFLVIAEAVMPRIEEWLVHPFDKKFSSVTDSSSVFTNLAEYVVESERGFYPRFSFVYSSYENETTVEFEPRRDQGPKRARYQGIKVMLTLLYRASEHDFRASEFHRLCDRKGPTITLVRAVNGRMAAAYNGESWGQFGDLPNPRGFLASIDEGYTLQNHLANNRARVFTYPDLGPFFGNGLSIADICHENERSFSLLVPQWGYGKVGKEEVEPSFLFGVEDFKVLEYEVFHVELDAIVCL